MCSSFELVTSHVYVVSRSIPVFELNALRWQQEASLTQTHKVQNYELHVNKLVSGAVAKTILNVAPRMSPQMNIRWKGDHRLNKYCETFVLDHS